MKKILTNNIGLKIASVIGAFFLWIIVVNIDDPVITRVYTGIQVEVTNETAITDGGKTYEIIDDSDVISVAVTAERSVIEDLSKDNIKAVADMKNITFMNTVPIELKSTRYSEKINSLTSRNTTISVLVEDRKEKQMKISVTTEGQVASGYIPGSVSPSIDVIKVSGPESKVDLVSKAEICVDFADMNESFVTSSPITLYDMKGNLINDPAIEMSKAEITANVEILEIKEIPVTANFIGTAAPGYGATGTVICDPSSIKIAGKGSAFDNLSAVKIPDSALSIDGATENVEAIVDVTNYLPKSVKLADPDFTGEINVIAVVEQHDTISIPISVSDISVINLPENYIAHIVSGEPNIMVEVSGLAGDLDASVLAGITGVIDANSLMPRLEEGEQLEEGTILRVGSNDGAVILNLPQGIIQNSIVTMEVIINYVEPTEEVAEEQ